MMKEDNREEYYGKVMLWWILGIMVTVFGLTGLYFWAVGPEMFFGG